MSRRSQAFFLVLATFLAGCASLPPPAREMVVLARVNGDAVTVGDLEQAFGEEHKGHGLLLAGQKMVRRFLEKVIDQRLLIQEARRIGLDQEPEIQKMLTELKGKRAAEAFYQDEVVKKVVISEEAIAASYERLGQRFQARHILVKNRQTLDNALDRLRAGEKFGEVALRLSQAHTAGRGGDLGIVQWGELDAELEEKLWALEKGQISEPFETAMGWNLLYVVEKVAVERRKLEETRSYIRGVLTRRQTKRLSDTLFRTLMRRAQGVINEAILLDILKAPEGEGPSSTMVVAEAAGEKITVGRFLGLVNLRKLRQLPPAWARKQMRRLLEQEVFRMLLRQAGLARGYGNRPEIVRELDKLEGKLALDRLLSGVVFAQLQVSGEEVKAYYQAHATEFTEPEAVKMRIIQVETEEEAGAVMTELQDGKDFASLARRTSQDRFSAESGGDIGWIRKGQVNPEVEEVAFSLEVGDVGMARIQPADASVIIRLEQRREARLKPFDEVREQARQRALRQKSQDTLKRWVTRLRESSSIQIDNAAISRAIAEYQNSLRKKATAGQGERKP